MDTVRHLIRYFFRLAFSILFIVIVWWLVSLLFPALTFSQMKQLVFGDGKHDLLPSPRTFAHVIKDAPTPYDTTTPGAYGTVFNGYGYVNNSNSAFLKGPTGGLVTYSTDNNNGQNVSTSQRQNVSQSRSLYIRNLSIYEGGNISSNLTFIGEARNTMYKDGMFPVIIINQRGDILGVSSARATGAWAVTGWSRFEVVISHRLPSGGVPCAVVFEQARAFGDNQQPVRVGIPVKCN